MNFAICLLAFGDTHITECNNLIKSLYDLNENLNIFVYTNDLNSKLNNKAKKIISNVKFNYNLKVEAIGYGLLYYDTVLFMDTDTYINNLTDFSLLENLNEDGFYTTKKPYNVFTHAGEIVSVHSLINNTKYGKEILKLSGIQNLSFIDEQKFIIKIEDKVTREYFYETWKKLFMNTSQTHIKNKDNGLMGIYEGLIISATCNMIQLPIIHTNINTKSIFNQLSHYGWDTETPSNNSLI